MRNQHNHLPLTGWRRVAYRVYDFVVPRFSTEQVALIANPATGMYGVACIIEDVRPGETFDAIGTFRGFAWLGCTWFARPVGAPAPFVNPHDRETSV